MEYEVNVGMECHAELLTNSKMFCGCRNEFGGEPNTRTCPVCLGLPGSLPTFNAKAVEHVVRTALALHCEISLHTIFHRKNYFYPDLPKGYQISQYGHDADRHQRLAGDRKGGRDDQANSHHARPSGRRHRQVDAQRRRGLLGHGLQPLGCAADGKS